MNDWCGRTVLVTGYGGFLGGALARTLLTHNARVLGMINPARQVAHQFRNPGAEGAVTIVPADIRDFASLHAIFVSHTIDTVFHLAAQTLPTLAREEPCLTFEVNTRGTWNLLEAVRLAPAAPRIVLSSTDSVYGENDGAPFTEDAERGSIFPYEASKSCAEMVARCYFKTYGMPIATARFCNIYGPTDVAESRLMAGTIEAALAGRRQHLRGDGSAVRNYLYVDDAVRALLTLAGALDDPAVIGEAFNFCDEQPYSVQEIVSRVLALVGRPDLAPVLGAGTPGEISIKRASADKAARLLGWRATTSLDMGLRSTIEWHRTRSSGAEA